MLRLFLRLLGDQRAQSAVAGVFTLGLGELVPLVGQRGGGV